MKIPVSPPARDGRTNVRPVDRSNREPGPVDGYMGVRWRVGAAALAAALLGWAGSGAPLPAGASPGHGHGAGQAAATPAGGHGHGGGQAADREAITRLYDIVSMQDGDWSAEGTWMPARLPEEGDRVFISPGTTVTYDRHDQAVFRAIRVSGRLTFARDRDTELHVGDLRVQPGLTPEAGVDDIDDHDHAHDQRHQGAEGVLEVGSAHEPIPRDVSARIVLHHVEGANPDNSPAIIARPGGRMEFHGHPLQRTWWKLAADTAIGDTSVLVDGEVGDWQEGDEIIITGAIYSRSGDYPTEERVISRIEGRRIHFEGGLEQDHLGEGEFRSEVANLSRNVIIESADPDGVRGHTMYHWDSAGSISYARFAHLGKKEVLGRYPIHFHLVRDTMRGSSVIGAAIVDSHNRWMAIHGTYYLVVRDCVGYQSIGHGYFLEDGTEVYNLLDRNLGVQAFAGRRMRGQDLPFDPNDGAAFWWANGLNTFTRNVGVESEEYGFRYDMQHTRSFDANLDVRQPDGSYQTVDVRTLPVWRFEDNEAHGNFAGMVLAGNGGNQPDVPIRDQQMLERIESIDWTGPDERNPHMIRNFTIWAAHYAFRPQTPSMLVENLRIHDAPYGVYRPGFDRHVYRNVHLSSLGPEPFNRGMDDSSAQTGSFTVDGLKLEDMRNNSQVHPLVHMADNNLSGTAECHFRNVELINVDPRRVVFNRGGSVRADPIVDRGVPFYIHDHYGPGRHALIVSTRAADLYPGGAGNGNGNGASGFHEDPPLTGDESRVREITDVTWPELLDPVDSLPPATTILDVREHEGRLVVRGVSHDNGDIVEVLVNGARAEILSQQAGVADWVIELDPPADGKLSALAVDDSGNRELTPHQRTLR